MKRFIFTLLASTLLICGCSQDTPEESKEGTTEESIFQSDEAETSEVEASEEESSEYKSIEDLYQIPEGPIELGGKVEKPSIDTGECVYDTENMTAVADAIFAPYSITKYSGNKTKLIIPAEVDGIKILRICPEVFYGNTKIEEIYIEDGIEGIEYRVFEKCISLKKIRLPSTLKTISGDAFKDCINLKEIYIPDSVTKIGSSFVNCEKLEAVRIPQTTKLSPGAFEGCVSLKGEAIIPSGNEYVSQTYKDCTGITKVTICEGPTRMFRYAFMGMTRLQEVIIPESIIEFDEVEDLFIDCKNLKVIYVKKGSYAEYIFRKSPWSDLVVSVGG